MVDKVILQRNVMHQYTRDQMLRQSNIRVTCDLIYRDNVAPTNCPVAAQHEVATRIKI